MNIYLLNLNYCSKCDPFCPFFMAILLLAKSEENQFFNLFECMNIFFIPDHYKRKFKTDSQT